EQIDAHVLSGFDYVALGHLHQAHYVLYDYIRYAGSLLKYLLSDAGHQKGYYVVILDGNGETTIEKKPISPVRYLLQLKGFLKDIMELKRSEYYVFVTLSDETPILSPMEKIRSVFPNALHVERGLDSIFSEHQESAGMNQPKQQLSQQELFKGFYKEVK